jgi:cell division protein ZapD
MSNAVYEFPLNEKVRTYLRLEQLFKQLKQAKDYQQDWQFIGFFESLFTLLDLLERLDIRNDVLKDIESHEKNLVHWSQHPKIDSDALQAALQRILRLREQLKQAKKIGSNLKDDKFLSSIRQRFAIPGGTCSFDLPNLFYWLKQPLEFIQKDINQWMLEFTQISEAIDITLSFLREKGRFVDTEAANGFYQGVAEDKNELIRVYSTTDQGYYPVLSGNKYRYAIRFMWFDSTAQDNSSVDSTVSFKLASC